MNLDKFSLAAVQFDKALSIDPTNIDSLIGKGLVMENHLEFTKAIQYFNKVLSLDPANKYALKFETIAEKTLSNKTS
jgi:lipoprotein NlpI